MKLESIKEQLSGVSLSLPAAKAAEPLTLSLRIQLANALNDLDDFKRADELCCEILNANPDHQGAHMLRIKIAFCSKDHLREIEMIDKVHEKFGDNPQLQIRKANALRLAGRREDAITILQVLHKEHPEDHTLIMKLAKNHVLVGNRNVADALFLDVLSKEPSNRNAWIGLIDNALAVGDPSSATDRAERALVQLPGDVAIMTRAGRAMADIGRAMEAADLLRSAVEAASKPDPSLQLAFADVLKKIGKLEEAEDVILSVLAADPANKMALNRYVDTALSRGDIDEAISRCEVGLGKFPKASDFLRKKATLLAQVGRLGDAIDVLRRLQQYHPDDIASKIALARAIMQQKDLDAADAIFAEILKSHPTNRAALLGRVDIAEARGDLELAMSLLKGSET